MDRQRLIRVKRAMMGPWSSSNAVSSKVMDRPRRYLLGAVGEFIHVNKVILVITVKNSHTNAIGDVLGGHVASMSIGLDSYCDNT